MAFDSKGLDDYIDVAQRIVDFRGKHPEGSLQPVNPAQPFEIRELVGTDKNGKEQRGTFIIYTAAAYRSPDDPRPGIGCAYEVFPGRTPYTAGSELQNAETAAWGRAIVAALGADAKAGIASQQEVRNRQAERNEPAPKANGQQRGQIARPAVQAAPEPDAEIDEEAQALADEAATCVSVNELKAIHAKGLEKSKLRSYIADPATGTKGQLGPYLNFRKKVLEDTDAAWSDLYRAAEAHRMEVSAVEDHVRKVSGKTVQGATAADVRKAIDALKAAA